MKALLKFFLLLALIIGGKLTKQAAPATVANVSAPATHRNAPVVLVHQVLTSEPVAPATQQPPQLGSTVIMEMF
ncbi:hypothetical protein GCM10023185_37550 [Hymenobacter saemangeumensis]|uniref:Uncharacterized protein n=1 Tax=Hymenobacter saemangeumensis TaxID=1084522 RepID=A0ABP8IQV5_9BACT